MSYTAIDLLEKIIGVTGKKKEICKISIEGEKKELSMYMINNIFIKNLDKSIQHYNDLKEEIKNSSLEDIDFVIYDKISFLIDDFNRKQIITESTDVKSIVECCLNLQKGTLALYIDIQGRLIKNEDDVKTKTYKIIEDMISEKEKYIKDLEDFCNKYC
ncbi:hypothetical protein [Clostridium lundense]|uniref:hypothetical protein n=1 Tax=Clostridium lundense TaxID=319475 RepID=UPI0004818BD6|nr:hypothetical protein [Clostridium lundense]